MSFRKSARQYVNVGEHSQNSTTALFVQNHTSPKHLLEQVDTLYTRGHLHQAHELIECIVDNNHALVSTADLFVVHAKIYIELYGFNVDAQCCIQQALMLEPTHAHALVLQELARLHEEFRDGLYIQAQDTLREFLTNDPQNIYARYLLGYNLFWKNGSDAEALVMLEKCVKDRPSFLRAWLSLAMAYKKSQELAKAEEAFQECLSLDTNVTNIEFYKSHLQSI